MNQQPQEIKVKITDDQLRGAYANMMRVSHQKECFVLDFAHINPPQGIVTARIITSPSHLKEMIRVLQENLAHYEEKFGQVEAPHKNEQEIGFQTSSG
jgi:hypothetical protein